MALDLQEGPPDDHFMGQPARSASSRAGSMRPGGRGLCCTIYHILRTRYYTLKNNTLDVCRWGDFQFQGHLSKNPEPLCRQERPDLPVFTSPQAAALDGHMAAEHVALSRFLGSVLYDLFWAR